MVRAALRAMLQCDEHVGECVGGDARTGAAEHAVCGDRVQLSVRCVDGQLHDVRWRAEGCPATLAVAALAARTWRSLPLPRAESALQAALAAHGGLDPHERHAAALVLRALAAATGT